jgi:preprotein translocase subunit SecY
MLRNHELTKRVLWTALILAIYALGQKIILPTIDPLAAQATLEHNDFLHLVGLMTGGNTSMPTLLMLGLGPYMTATIVWQAITALDLPLINRLSPRATGLLMGLFSFALGLVQAFTYTYTIRHALVEYDLFGVNCAFALSMLLLSAGGMLTIFIGNENTSRGLGGPVALIIPMLAMGLPNSLKNGWGMTPFAMTPLRIAIAIGISLIFIPLALRVNDAELRLDVERPMLDSAYSNSYMPIRLLASGAMPFMFSSMIFTMPRTLVNGFGWQYTHTGRAILHWTTYTRWPGVITYGVIVLLLGYAFGLMNFQPARQARQLKESGDYVIGVTPGDDTERYLLGHFARLTFVGDFILAALGVTPLIVAKLVHNPGLANYSSYLGNLFILITIVQTIIQQFSALWNKNRYRLLDGI